MYHQSTSMSAKKKKHLGWVGGISNLTLEKPLRNESRQAAIQTVSLPRKQQQEVYNFIRLRFCASWHVYICYAQRHWLCNSLWPLETVPSQLTGMLCRAQPYCLLEWVFTSDSSPYGHDFSYYMKPPDAYFNPGVDILELYDGLWQDKKNAEVDWENHTKDHIFQKPHFSVKVVHLVFKFFYICRLIIKCQKSAKKLFSRKYNFPSGVLICWQYSCDVLLLNCVQIIAVLSCCSIVCRS